jgi:hypothetical protein
MRKRVKAAINESKDPTSTTTTKKKKKKSGGTAQSEDVDDSCAYDPKVAATARPFR